MDEHTTDPTVDPPPPGQTPTGWNAMAGRWEHATIRRAVEHGVRLFNGREYHGAHDCFEAEWYNYGNGTTESAFLHGLVQVAAGVHKWADLDDVVGMSSLCETAVQYLHGVPSDFYGVDVLDVRVAITAAPETPTKLDGWSMRLDGDCPAARPADFAFLAALP